MIGTVVGAVAIVLLAVCFPDDCVPFLIGLALWGGACAFAAMFTSLAWSFGCLIAEPGRRRLRSCNSLPSELLLPQQH
ncbi:hypothetical protein B4Q13_18870, partial [Lacticaseibacillus rhamnosus]